MLLVPPLDPTVQKKEQHLRDASALHTSAVVLTREHDNNNNININT